MKQHSTTDPDRAEQLIRLKRTVLVVLIVMAGFFGFLDVVFAWTPGWPKTSFMIETLASSLCLLLWCAWDAELRGFRLTSRMRVAIVLISLVAFPVFASKSRARGGWALLGLSFLFLLVMIAVSAAGGLIAVGASGR